MRRVFHRGFVVLFGAGDVFVFRFVNPAEVIVGFAETRVAFDEKRQFFDRFHNDAFVKELVGLKEKLFGFELGAVRNQIIELVLSVDIHISPSH